jgi:hypothetical protein
MQSISGVWAEMMLVWDFYSGETSASVDTPARRWQDNNNGAGGEDAYLLSRVANRGAGRKFFSGELATSDEARGDDSNDATDVDVPFR